MCCSSSNMPNPNFPSDGRSISVADPKNRPKPAKPDYDLCKARAAPSWSVHRGGPGTGDANTILAFCCAGKATDRIGGDGTLDKSKLCGTCCDQGTPPANENPYPDPTKGPGNYNASCTATCDALFTTAICLKRREDEIAVSPVLRSRRSFHRKWASSGFSSRMMRISSLLFIRGQRVGRWLLLQRPERIYGVERIICVEIRNGVTGVNQVRQKCT